MITMINAEYLDYLNPRAPWNEPEKQYRKVEVDYSCTMRRSVEIPSAYYASDPEDVNLAEDYHNECYSPKQLIDILHEAAESLAQGKMPVGDARTWKMIADECNGWELDDEEIV